MGPCGVREDHFVGKKRVRIVLVCPTLKQASQLGTNALKNTIRPQTSRTNSLSASFFSPLNRWEHIAGVFMFHWSLRYKYTSGTAHLLKIVFKVKTLVLLSLMCIINSRIIRHRRFRQLKALANFTISRIGRNRVRWRGCRTMVLVGSVVGWWSDLSRPARPISCHLLKQSSHRPTSL